MSYSESIEFLETGKGTEEDLSPTHIYSQDLLDFAKNDLLAEDINDLLKTYGLEDEQDLNNHIQNCPDEEVVDIHNRLEKIFE